jgi:Fanconi anemia group M protein
MKTKKIFNIFSEKKIKECPKEKKKIIADYREKNSLVISNIISRGVDIEFKELKVADYIVGNVAIERKTVSDFISSMINKRLLNQLEGLKQYEKKLLLIEGMEERELYNENNEIGVNANAIRGFLLSIVLRHNIPIIFTKNSEDTAKYFLVMLNKKEREMSMHAKRKSRGRKEQIEFIIESFPGIGPKTSRKLLEKFRTVKNIMNASEKELKECIGKKAYVLIELINKAY